MAQQEDDRSDTQDVADLRSTRHRGRGTVADVNMRQSVGAILLRLVVIMRMIADNEARKLVGVMVDVQSVLDAIDVRDDRLDAEDARQRHANQRDKPGYGRELRQIRLQREFYQAQPTRATRKR